jgi:hypothetical protein
VAAIYPVSLLEVLDGSELERFISEKRALTAGEILEGRVIKLISETEMLIDFGRFRAKAQVSMPFQEGENLRVVVLETGEKIKFQIQAPEKGVTADTLAKSGFLEKVQWLDLSRFPDFLNRLTEQLAARETSLQLPALQTPPTLVGPSDRFVPLPGTGMPPQLLQTILQTLSSMNHAFRGLDLEQDPATLAPRIKNLVQNSGLFWDNKVLALTTEQTSLDPRAAPDRFEPQGFAGRLLNLGSEDIKFQLMNLLDKMKNGETALKQEGGTNPRLQAVRSELEGFVETMIGQHRQIFEETQQKMDNQAIFSFNLPFEQAQMQGRMKLYVKGGKNKKKGSGWRIALLLQLSDLGGIRFDFYYLSQVLRLTVFVMDRLAQQEFLEYAGQLLEQLRQHIETVHIDVMVSRAQIDHFESEDWVDEAGDNQLRLDIKV